MEYVLLLHLERIWHQDSTTFIESGGLKGLSARRQNRNLGGILFIYRELPTRVQLRVRLQLSERNERGIFFNRQFFKNEHLNENSDQEAEAKKKAATGGN